jgi:chromosome segregation ATPase
VSHPTELKILRYSRLSEELRRLRGDCLRRRTDSIHKRAEVDLDPAQNTAEGSPKVVRMLEDECQRLREEARQLRQEKRDIQKGVPAQASAVDALSGGTLTPVC